MSQSAPPHAAAGVPHPLGFGARPATSAGIASRPKRHTLIPVESHRCANTPPPAALNPGPKLAGLGSLNPHPEFAPSVERHVVPSTFDVYASAAAGARESVHAEPAPEWRVYWLFAWSFTPSMMSISPADGQFGPADHHAGQVPQPCGMCEKSAMKRPEEYDFLVLMRTLNGGGQYAGVEAWEGTYELRLPPAATTLVESTAMIVVLSLCTFVSPALDADAWLTKFTFPCVGSAPVKKFHPLRAASQSMHSNH